MSGPARRHRGYRLLLRAFPRDFRRDFSDDMEALLDDRLREAGPGLVARARVWAGAVADVAVHAPAEWLERAAGPGAGGWLDGALADVRHAARALRRSPGFTALAVITLALGIGADAAVFSVVDAVLLRPLPYRQPERLVIVWPQVTFNVGMVGRVAEALPALESMSGATYWGFTLTGGGEPEELTVARVTANHFDVLGVRPALGRGFLPEDGAPGRDDVVVLGWGLWMRRFGGDPGVVGRTIDLAGGEHARHTVIGVLGEDFRPAWLEGETPQAWTPLPVDPSLPLDQDNTWYVNARVGRLAPGATAEGATRQLRAAAERFRDTGWNQLDDEEVRGASVEPLHAHQVADVSGTLWMLLGVVGLVLLMACVNVANLLLARGEARGHDLAVRAALGAGRLRVARHLLAEAALLGMAGGAAGLAVATLAVEAFARRAPATLPRGADVTVDAPVLAFAAGVVLLSVALFGVVPALRATAGATALRRGSPGSGGGSHRLGRTLVGAQVALAVVVVAASALMLRSLAALYAEDPGFEAAGLVAFHPVPPSSRYPEAADHRRYYARVRERVAALPGVTGVAGIQLLPTRYGNWSFPTYLGDVPVPEGEPPPSINFRVVTPGYPEVMGIPLLAGRTLTPADDEEGERVALVNRALADRYWPGAHAVGRTFRLFSREGEPFRVVGVLGDVRQHGLDREPRPELYLTEAQYAYGPVSLWMVARTDGPEGALLGRVRDAVWEVDADAPITDLDRMERVVARSAGNRRFVTALLVAFGLVAGLLGAVGVYGVTAYTVARRVPEMGLRLALGASRPSVLRGAVARGMVPVGLGLAAGLAGAAAAMGFLDALLWKVAPRDPLTLGGVALLMAVVAAAATILPAWRASRVDPARVLRDG